MARLFTSEYALVRERRSGQDLDLLLSLLAVDGRITIEDPSPEEIRAAREKLAKDLAKAQADAVAQAEAEAEAEEQAEAEEPKPAPKKRATPAKKPAAKKPAAKKRTTSRK